jgi:hypothetical protein
MYMQIGQYIASNGGVVTAEHVGTKSKEQCIEHYTNVYKNSPFFPLPV